MDALTGVRRPLSTSNLVRPDRAAVMHYARAAHEGEPIVRLLEQRLAAFHQVQHCIALCNGFWGLVLAIRLLALAGRTDVLMPSLTYRRMADVVAWARLRPRFCEVDAGTLACTAATMEATLTDDVGLILAVHPIVGCCDVTGAVELARRRSLPLLFDSVESTFEVIDGGKIGGFGDAECFSLHASKLLNGLEGGYVTTNSAAVAEGMRGLRGGTRRNEFDLRLEPLHAAMALACLDDLPDQVVRNRARYERYKARLRRVPGLELLEFEPDRPTSYKTIVVALGSDWPLSRDETLARLNGHQVLARAYYYPPLHAKAMAYPHVPATLPLTEQLSQRFMLLPCGDHVSLDDVDDVIGLLMNMGP